MELTNITAAIHNNRPLRCIV